MNVYMNDGRVLDWCIYITYDTNQINLLQSKTTWNDDGKNLNCEQNAITPH